jgi:dinuclear metal center YbgI/SA1388 family protein
MVVLKEIVTFLEQVAPLPLQESYDNSGLLVGDINEVIEQVLVTLDITDDVVEEAINQKCQLIVSHHPLSLTGFKSLTGRTMPERCLLKAIRNNIAIYSAHTNIDAVPNGVSGMMASKLGLVNCNVLEPKLNSLLKLAVFVPESHAQLVRDAVFNAGAGFIGNYSHCSFNALGQGTFKGNDNSQPFAGKPNEMHIESEVRIETVLPVFLKDKVVGAMLKAHPYEEVAYDLMGLQNEWGNSGFGCVGELPEEMDTFRFLSHMKEVFGCGSLKYTTPHVPSVKRIALCGGSGSSLLKKAKSTKADVFITGDVKYHQFFEAENSIIMVDIGHYESEQFTKELFFELLTKKFPNFAVRLSKVNSNPIKYL